MNRFTKGSLLAGTIMAGAVIATPAYAQDTESAESAQEDNFIVVTGSRIQQRNVETAAPVAVVAAEEFQLTGAVNVENVVNALPQVVPGVTGNSNNPGNGTATLDLRGLGEERTLVLVNGRRWLSFDTQQIVDLNTIPNFLIETVDVVTGGASAVYGSDAMSGVVNFNLKKVEGVEFGGQYSITERGDGARYQMYGAIGTSFDDGRGSATVFAEYYQRDDIFQGDRDFSNFAIGGETFGLNLLQFGSSTVPQGRFNAPGSTAVANGTDLNGDGDVTDPGETPTAPLAQGLVIDDAIFDTPGSPRRRAGDTYNYAPVNYLQVPQERYLLGGYADYEFVDGHRAYTEVAFVNNRVATELAATPVTGTFNVDIATVSQFLDAATIAELNLLDQREAAANAQRVANGLSPLPAPQLGVVSASIQRRVLESGGRNSLDERNAFRVLAGVTGAITDNLNYDAYYSYARTRNSNVQQGNISRSAFQAGLDGTGTALNIFGQGTLTPAMVNAITIQAQNGDISTVEVASGSISGFLGELTSGAGDVGFAAGVEYRRVGSQFIPDTALSSGDVIGFNAGQATEGAYDVRELFAELNVPIFDNGSQRLELSGAARYSDYSLDAVGGVWTYAGGAEFDVVPSVKLRGQYQRAVRAPNVGELFGGQAIGFPGATDPCGDPGFLAANPGASQTCVATGVPAGNVGNANAIQLNAQIPALFGGNPNLQEETSTSWSAGVVLRPDFIPGLTITADYFDIVIDDAISVAGGSLQGLLNLCYGTAQDVNSPLCQPFVGIRNGDGAITVDAPPLVAGVNVAELGTSGVDVEVNYGTSLPFAIFNTDGDSRLNFSFLGTWTESYFLRPLQGQPEVFECAGKFGGDCPNTGDPRSSFSWVSRLSWIDGPVTLSTRWRHLSAVDDADDGTDYTAFNGVERIPAYDIFDLTLAVEATENVTITFGINNLLDTLPGTPEFDANGFVTNRPSGLLLGDNQEQANTFPSTYNVNGRDFFASVAFSF
ncbi:TonB-dependent receptor domain-containing protein [Erythrobacter sp. JK5]|uniref:TonB-dependent receptor domain-containing protein n=1 Tax=Erythrobacter sp. JK5 TaxID=2829500 RepID=UPI001BA8F832|nr:TonB-dependent receptor [Erythrobacter sp. JK5]QUL36610.1 TonB-dependent receptor [Erythrobacter sp. JK5]